MTTVDTPEVVFDGSLPRAFLRPALHIALIPGPSHGYDLLMQLRGFGLASVDLGGIYRSLRVMERDGAVTSGWEASDLGPPRRVYELSDAGVAAADAYLSGLRATRRHLDGLLTSVLTPNELLAR